MVVETAHRHGRIVARGSADLGAGDLQGISHFTGPQNHPTPAFFRDELRYPVSSTIASLLGCVSPALTCETRFVTAPLGSATPISRAVIDRLRSAVGPAGIIEDATDIAPYCKSWRDDWQGAVPPVLRPKSTEEVAAIVRICAEAGVAIVPQGGNTGLTGGSQPHADMSEVIVSTSRMKRVRAIDPINDTITVEAGVVLKDIQYAADRRRPPVSAQPRRGRLLPDRRQHLHQRRRRAGAALRQYAQPRARAGGGAARRQRLERPARRCARTTPATT